MDNDLLKHVKKQCDEIAKQLEYTSYSEQKIIYMKSLMEYYIKEANYLLKQNNSSYHLELALVQVDEHNIDGTISIIPHEPLKMITLHEGII